MAEGGGEGGGRGTGGGVRLGEVCGGRHALGLATINRAIRCDGRSVRLATDGENAWRGEGRLGRRRPLQQGRGGKDSKYTQYNEHRQETVYCPSFLSVCFPYSGIHEYRVITSAVTGVKKKKKEIQ